jgi:hypothetical protein
MTATPHDWPPATVFLSYRPGNSCERLTEVGHTDAATLWGYVQTLIAKKRGRPTGVYSRAHFDAWLTAS